MVLISRNSNIQHHYHLYEPHHKIIHINRFSFTSIAGKLQQNQHQHHSLPRQEDPAKFFFGIDNNRTNSTFLCITDNIRVFKCVEILGCWTQGIKDITGVRHTLLLREHHFH